MSLGITLTYVMDIIGGYQWNIQLISHGNKNLINLLQLRNGVSLYFQIEIAKCLLIP